MPPLSRFFLREGGQVAEEFRDIDRLRELVREFGQRGASRLTGIPRTTIQYMLARDRTSEKWKDRVREGYGALTETRLGQKGMPPSVAEPFKQASPKQLEEMEKKWEKIKQNVGTFAWQQYQERYEKIVRKMLEGKKLSKSEKEILEKGLGPKVKREVKERALKNLWYTQKDWDVLLELYGRRRRWR